MIAPTVVWPTLAWLAIIPLAIANGALREFLLAPRLGMRTAQPISGALLMIAIGAVTWLLIGRLEPQRKNLWLAVGAAWLFATLAFEFGMGALNGRTWTEMLDAYRFANHNIWPIVLAWVAVAPVSMACFRRRIIPTRHVPPMI